MDNYNIIYGNLPYKVRGFTMHNGSDDFYTIILNARMSYSQNKLTLKHELQHISNGDIFSGRDVNFIENYTH